MPSGNSGVKYAGSASGWTSSSAVSGNDGSYATDNYLVVNEGFGVFSYDPTADLATSTFGATVPGMVVGVVVEIEVKRSGAPTGAAVQAQLTVGGTKVGSAKSMGAVGTSDTALSSGSSSDAWGASITAAQSSSIGVELFVEPSGSTAGLGTASIDYVRITVHYSQPDAFTFTDITNQTPNTTVTSNAITVSGAAGSVSVSVTGGEWNKNGGSYTGSTGTAVNGDVIIVRHTTSGNFSSVVNTVLTVGGTSDTFSSTTAAADSTPSAFSFATRNTATPSTSYDSGSINVAGINTSTAISVSGGQYSKNGGAFTGSAGTVNAGDSIVARGTSSGSYGGSQVVTVTIGGVAGTFTINTRAADTTPNAYTWTNQSGVATSTLRTSNSITIGGIEAAATVAFSAKANGTTVGPAVNPYEYRINGGSWLNATTSTSITNGQTLELRLGSSASGGVAATITTTIGGVARTWTVTTTTGDDIPEVFTFVDEPNAAVGQVIESNEIIVTGTDISANVTFATGGTATGHQYRKYTGGAWGSWVSLASTTAVSGDKLQVRLTAPAVGDSGSITVTITGVADTWDVTGALPDTAPTPFSFVDVSGVDPLTLNVSAAITVLGVNSPTAISISGADGQYRVNGGSWTNAAGTVVKNDLVEARVTSAATLSTTVGTTVNIGGATDTFSVTTRSPDLASQYVIHFRETPYGSDV